MVVTKGKIIEVYNPLGTYDMYKVMSLYSGEILTASKTQLVKGLPDDDFNEIFEDAFDASHDVDLIELSWIGCLTSQLTIFQSYMWRHIDVQADWRRSLTYGRAPNAIDIS